MPLPHWSGADALTTAYWTGRDAMSRAMAWPTDTFESYETAGPQVDDLTQLFEVVALGQALSGGV